MNYILRILVIFSALYAHNITPMMLPPYVIKITLNLLAASIPSSTAITQASMPLPWARSIIVLPGSIMLLGACILTPACKNFIANQLPLSAYLSSTMGMRLALLAGADPNAQDEQGVTPLHYARGNYHTIKFLLEHGADPNIKDGEYGATPLYFQHNPACVYLLIKYGADPRIPDNDGTTFLDARYDLVYNAIVEELEYTGEIAGPKMAYLKPNDRLSIISALYRQTFAALKQEQNNKQSYMHNIPDELISKITRYTVIDQIGDMDTKAVLKVENYYAQKRTKKKNRKKAAQLKKQLTAENHTAADDADFLERHKTMLTYKRPSGIM